MKKLEEVLHNFWGLSHDDETKIVSAIRNHIKQVAESMKVSMDDCIKFGTDHEIIAYNQALKELVEKI